MCLLSGACDILAMECCATQDVEAAIERHSARYGVPGYIYIDNGNQMKADASKRCSYSSSRCSRYQGCCLNCKS